MSGSDVDVEEEGGDEDVDTDDCKVGFSDGCGWPAAATTAVPSDDGRNKWMNCAVLPSRVESEIISVIKELTTNNSTRTDINFINFSEYLYVFL